MKKKTITAFIILLFLLSQNILSSENIQREENILFDNIITSIGAYIAPSFCITNISKSNSILSGAKGGIILNNKYIIGFCGFGLINNIKAKKIENIKKNQYLELGYGGILLGKLFTIKNMFASSVFMIIGGGGIQIVNDDNMEIGKEDTFFVIEPGFTVDLPIDKHIRLEYGLSYRKVYDTSLSGYTNKDLSHISHSISVKFGFF